MANRNNRLQIYLLAVVLFMLNTTSGLTAGGPSPLPIDLYPVFQDDLQLQELDQTLEQSLVYLKRLPPATRLPFAQKYLPVQRLIDSTVFFQKLVHAHPEPAQLNRQLRQYFDLYRFERDEPLQPTQRQVLVTGYYHPNFSGSLTKEPPFLYPLYAQPDDLVIQTKKGSKPIIGQLRGGKFVPYWTRKEIEQGNLLQGQELVWLKDPFDVFVLHVQGSGTIRLTDGTLRGIHYAQSNGRAYTSIGAFLVATKRMHLADVTMDSIRLYLVDHPQERDLILHQNDSFIFFHWSKAGPTIGSLGQALTPGRSIATDQHWYPPGALAYIETRRPVLTNGQATGWAPMRRFVCVQDTGSGLSGPGRADIFWGAGEDAGTAAGLMKEDGRLYLLLLKEQIP